MGKTVNQYEQEILKVIKKQRIFSVLDIFAFYKGCSRATFYSKSLDKLDSIKVAISDNKIITKQALKAKWAKSSNPTLQIALYKSICTDEERQHLNQSYIDHSTKGKEIGIGDRVVTPADIKRMSQELDDDL